MPVLSRGAASVAHAGISVLSQAGNIFALFVEIVAATFRRPFQFREFIEQSWFIASVTIVPTALVAIPFGAIVSLQTGSLIGQLGAESFTGAASVLAVVQQGAPVVTALLVAGAAGSAVCADLGARTVREEIDALATLGINPVQRLVVPRVLGMMLVSMFLSGLVSVVGVTGGYFFNVILQNGTPGSYVASFAALAQLPDLWIGEIKALIFGLIAGVVASYKGLNPGGGPKGVGDAVNQSVVISFLLLFLANLVLTAVYLQVVPAKGA